MCLLNCEKSPTGNWTSVEDLDKTQCPWRAEVPAGRGCTHSRSAKRKYQKHQRELTALLSDGTSFNSVRRADAYTNIFFFFFICTEVRRG